MKAIQFLKSLLPNFAKQTVLEDIRITRLVLMTVTAPAYKDALRLFGNRKFTNPGLQKDRETFRRSVKGASGANTIVAIEKIMADMLRTLDLVEKLVERDYADDIEGAGVTYYKAAVLQMLESIGFAGDYANKYLNYVLVIEAAELADENGEAKDSNGDTVVIDDINAAIVPAEVRFLNERFTDFCTVMDTLSKPTDKLKIDFDAIADINITEAGDKVIAHSVGVNKVDPFRHGFVPLFMNPIYHVRMKVAEYQHFRYEKAKEEKEILQLRKLKMERALAGKKDPALEKQIEYTQERIEDLATQIRKTEEQYA